MVRYLIEMEKGAEKFSFHNNMNIKNLNQVSEIKKKLISEGYTRLKLYTIRDLNKIKGEWSFNQVFKTFLY